MHIKWTGRDAQILYEAPKDSGSGETPDTPTDGETPDSEPTVEELRQKLQSAEARIGELNKEQTSRRLENERLTRELEKHNQAKMSESERLTAQIEQTRKEAETAQSLLRQARAEVEIAKHAVQHNVDVSLLTKLVDIQFDDNDMPTGVGDAVTKVLADYPQLKPQPASGNPANPGRKTGLTLDEVKKMSPDEINRRWDEIKPLMEASR